MLGKSEAKNLSIVRKISSLDETPSRMSKLWDYSNLMLTAVYFGVMIIFNMQAGSYISHHNTDTISLFLSLNVIQIGVGFLLVVLSVKKDGTNK